MLAPHCVIFGLEGTCLSAQEIAFFKEVNPWGYILFARNVETPAQVKELTSSLQRLSGRVDVPILIDQEGGRVARLRPPHWRESPPGACFASCYAANSKTGLEAVKLNSRLLAYELRALGINVDCLPVLDVPQPGAHDIIGDRAYGVEPQSIAALGCAAATGLLEGGVLPIIKHIPGHGRALVDSHASLPRVDASLSDLERIDFAPFKALADMPLAMTAHVIYEALDKDAPATTSSKIVQDIIRDYIGFDGLLMTDDLSMKALSGTFQERVQGSLAAGCDMILHCNGDMDEMHAIASACQPLSGKALSRADRALAALQPPAALDWDEAQSRLGILISDHLA